MKITVLTPTYNRANLLERVYQSLLKNNQHGAEIEWLIMDDESTDGTKEKVEKWKQENQISIQYEWQKNQGKMVAINQLVTKATGDVIIECDSDDYFTPDAFAIVIEAYQKYKEKTDIYGLCFLKYDQNHQNMGNFFKKEKTTMFDLYFREGETGEKALVFYSKIRKQYQYVLERGERFVTEASMYHKMDEKYKMICMNQPIMICEYQENGYSKNIGNQFKENPYGYYTYFKEILQKDLKKIPFKKNLYIIKHYILFSYLTKQYHIKSIRNFKNKVLYSFLLVPGIVMCKVKSYVKF